MIFPWDTASAGTNPTAPVCTGIITASISPAPPTSWTPWGECWTSRCQWLEDHWDHRFLVWDKDPLLEGLRALDPSVSVLPCNPSAENMARYLGEVVGPAQLEGTGARLVAVEVEETAKCKARWSL